ncbi:hypothetical protein [Altericista sp. CCNU0014]|uniref:hypothetical protein n=1 Tax=Altericista sp. CCNU0014 TaxID=3082949 RepID=UPI0038504D1D
MNSLKYLPWRSLFLASLLGVVAVKIADAIAGSAVNRLDSHSALIGLLLTRSGFTLIYACAGLAVGSLGVFFLERFERGSSIYSSTLWALVLCLLVGLWLFQHLDIAGLSLVEIHYIHILGTIVGVFWRGKRYWR